MMKKTMRLVPGLLIFALAVLALRAGPSFADVQTLDYCVPAGDGKWERHEDVPLEDTDGDGRTEAEELTARGAFEINESSPCPPEEQTQGLGNLCAENPRHPACNPERWKTRPEKRADRHPTGTGVVATPRGGVDTGGGSSQADGSSGYLWSLPLALVAAGLGSGLRRARR